MDIEKWSDIVPSAIKTPITIYQNRSSIHYWYKRALAAIDKGSTNVVVAGRPAVGKSVLVANLYGAVNELAWELPETSLSVETSAIQLGEWTKLVRVIPGQNSLQRLKGLSNAFNENKGLEGVIYVTDFGYTNVRDKSIKLRKIHEEQITTIEALRQYNLREELEDFKITCHKIAEAVATGSPKWLAIAVNKADLFFHELDKAQAYYHLESNSDFAKILKNTLNTVGSQHLHCVTMPICSYETDLEWNGEIIKTNIGGTDNRRILHKYFIKQLANISDNL
ncbi:MAG TPA: 50S ribosome-binding GTPase [Chitinophagales bacterium]|nr:50S ribosome-binding GTPase [Chitinophagales bacterium]